MTMTPETAASLRAPFRDEEIGLLPKVTCRDCSGKTCTAHKRQTCKQCRNYVSTAHIHISYVGHAETTDRLLQVDPEWSWEPVAWGPDGAPLIDNFGGMWIRLTVAGVTRLGYGHADGKRGADAIKETIGDSIRNAAMRFGVALDLWGAKFETVVGAPPRRRKTELVAESAEPVEEIPAAGPDEPMVTQEHHKTMHALWNELGYGGDDQRENRLNITARLLGLTDLQTSSALTAAQAVYVIGKLRDRISQMGAGA